MKLRFALPLAFALGVGPLSARSQPKKRALPPGYAEQIRLWHLPGPRPRGARAPLVLELVNVGERLELVPLRDDGGFSAADVEHASRALRDRRTEQSCGLEPRVLDLAYRVQRHFGVSVLRVLSACRVSHGRPSPHSQGSALDLIVPGQPDAEVARFARTLGYAGVGLYPVSSFVHLDSRPHSYFWIDTSGPGRRSAPRPAFVRELGTADARAAARGERQPSAPRSDSTQDPATEEDPDDESTDGTVADASTPDAARATRQ